MLVCASAWLLARPCTPQVVFAPSAAQVSLGDGGRVALRRGDLAIPVSMTGLHRAQVLHVVLEEIGRRVGSGTERPHGARTGCDPPAAVGEGGDGGSAEGSNYFDYSCAALADPDAPGQWVRAVWRAVWCRVVPCGTVVCGGRRVAVQ